MRRELSGTINREEFGHRNVVRKCGKTTDDEGRSHRRTRVKFDRHLPLPDGSFGGTFYIFGDVPQELTKFLQGTYFVLKDEYKEGSGVPIWQDFMAQKENDITMGYKFRRYRDRIVQTLTVYTP